MKELQALSRAFENIAPVWKIAIKRLNGLGFVLRASAYPDKRIVRLALHGKHRTRKKNVHRIERWLEKNNMNYFSIVQMHSIVKEEEKNERDTF